MPLTRRRFLDTQELSATVIREAEAVVHRARKICHEVRNEAQKRANRRALQKALRKAKA